MREADARCGEQVESGARVPRVAVAADPLGAQRVDEDEEQVHVVPLGELSDVVGRARGTGVVADDADHGGEPRENHEPRDGEPRPAAMQELFGHAGGV